MHSNSLVITRETCAFKRGVTVEQLCPCPPHDDGLARPAACCRTTAGACSLPALCGRPAAPCRTVGPVGLVQPGAWWALVGLVVGLLSARLYAVAAIPPSAIDP